MNSIDTQFLNKGNEKVQVLRRENFQEVGWITWVINCIKHVFGCGVYARSRKKMADFGAMPLFAPNVSQAEPASTESTDQPALQPSV